jgi:cyclopropane-fatty-acyl-phospholipid synthase
MTQAADQRTARRDRHPSPAGPACQRRGAAAGPARWPDVVSVPPGGARATIARFLLRRIAAGLPFRVAPAGGRPFGYGGPGAPVLLLHRPADFYRRVGAGGLIGLGESYMAGDWDCADLTALVTVLARQVDQLVPPSLQWLRRAYVRKPPPADDASVENARRNIRRHYDLSNELFGLFLDETMSYSAALFDTDAAGRPAGSASLLAAAQRRKIDRLLDLAGVGPGCRVLEIGTGWGELAIRAAARGANVRTITLSAEQRALAERRIADAGLSARVRVELADYRRVEGQFDAILSVEMIEAVGERYWPAYFAALDRLLAPGGRIGLQSIVMPHRRMMATRRTLTWILKYVFPGGLIPSVTSIEQNLAACTSLQVVERRDFGAHYAETLRIWRDQFCVNADRLPELGFDETFRRMWLLYLCYSEAGFRAGYLGVSQFLLARDSSNSRVSRKRFASGEREPARSVSQPAVAPRPRRQGAVDMLVPVIEQLLRGELPVRVRAWDGSEARQACPRPASPG